MPYRIQAWLPAVLVVLAGVPVVHASDVYFHRVLTETVLRERGWTDRAAVEDVVQANLATDVARLPQGARTGLAVLFPATDSRVPRVDRLAATASFSPRSTVGFHFNSLYRFADIEARWREFGEWTDARSREIGARRGDPGQVHTLLGMVAHHVQDFYAHANWVGIVSEFHPRSDPGGFPLWEELIEDGAEWSDDCPGFPSEQVRNRMWSSNAWTSDDESLGGLQTGRIRGEVVVGADPWRHRHHHGRRMDVIHHLAERAIHRWFDRVEAGVQAGRATAAVE